jgi:hypothetical protein
VPATGAAVCCRIPKLRETIVVFRSAGAAVGQRSGGSLFGDVAGRSREGDHARAKSLNDMLLLGLSEGRGRGRIRAGLRPQWPEALFFPVALGCGAVTARAFTCPTRSLPGPGSGNGWG